MGLRHRQVLVRPPCEVKIKDQIKFLNPKPSKS